VNWIVTCLKNGKRYFITFIDDCSDYTYMYLMKNKSNAFHMFKLFIKENETQFNKRIKCFRSDKGTKYGSHTVNEYYKELGIIHETNIPYFPEINGKSERKNKTFTELVVAIILNSGAAPH
jgi:transposase InsO family protein